MSGILKQFANSSVKRLNKSLKNFAATSNPEQLHLARVEIKKIRAILRLICELKNKVKFKNTFLPFRTIFRACGNIREPLVLKKLAASRKLSGYYPFTPPTHSILELRKNVPYLINSIRTKTEIILEISELIDEKPFRKYLSRKTQKLKEVLYPTLQIKNIHEARKMMKELYYIASLTKGNSRFKKFLKQYGRIAGDWHDYKLLIAIISKKAPMKIVSDLKDENKMRVKKMRKLISDFYSED